VKKIKAKEYWNEFIKSARDVAEPGLLFWDNTLNNGLDAVYEEYRPNGTNPCVTGDTLIMTDKGYYPIAELENQMVKVWNGKQFSTTTPKVTGENQDILKISLSDGRSLKCTPYHSWFMWEGSS